MSSVTYYSGPRGDMINVTEGTTHGSFKAGDLVIYDADGRIVIATSGLVAGIATKDATGTAGTAHLIEEITPDTKYVATYKASAITQALVGDLLDFTYTAGAHTLDETGATTDVYCVALKDAATTVSGQLIVKFMYTNFSCTK